MKRLLLFTVICLLLSACSNDESNISESGQVSKISYEAELSDRESPKKIIKLNTADAPTLEHDISLSVLGAEKRSDESRLISYTWIDNNAIALFVSADDNLRVYEIDLETGIIVAINTEIPAPANVKKHENGFVCEYEETSKVVFLDSSYILTDTIEYDNSVWDTKPHWEWRIVYSDDYKTRAFGRYEKLYLQSTGESETKLICNELFLQDEDDEPAYFLSPICFTKDGDKLVCSEESIYIDGTNNGAVIDLETSKIERFKSYSILGISPVDETKIFAVYAADWSLALSDNAEYIDVNDYTRHSFSLGSDFFSIAALKKDSYISDSWFDGSAIYSCVLEKIDFSEDDNDNELYHMFLYNFTDNSTTLIYKNYSASIPYKNVWDFQANPKHDGVVSVMMNEDTCMYELILFKIDRK